MIHYFDLSAMELHDGDIVVRPCDVRAIDEFTIWPFKIAQNRAAVGFVQVWRTTEGVAGIEIFVARQDRRRGIAARALSWRGTCAMRSVGKKSR